MKTTDITFWQLNIDNAGHFHAYIEATGGVIRRVDLSLEAEATQLLHALYNKELSLADIDEFYYPETEEEEIEWEEKDADCLENETIAWSFDAINSEDAGKCRMPSASLVLRMFAAMNGVDEFLETFEETHYSIIDDTLREMPLKFMREYLSAESDCMSILRYIAAEARKFRTRPEEIAAELETAAQELNLIESVDVRYWEGEEESNPAECEYMEVSFEVPRSQENSELRNAIADLIAGDEWKLRDIEWQGQQSWHRYTRAK